MPTLRILWAGTLFLICAGLTFSCSKQTPEQTQSAAPSQPSAPPAAQPAAAPTQPAQPIPSGTVIASAQYSDDPDLRCDLLEVKRASGGALMIRWRIVNTASAQPSGLKATQPKAIYYNFGWGDLYYTDPSENKKYNFLTDADGNRILDVFNGNLPDGQQRANWAKFPAPPATSTKISVVIPKFPPFEDVPVAQ
jgi:hypothetical protein